MKEKTNKHINVERDKIIQGQALQQEAAFTFDRCLIPRERTKDRALKIAIYTFLFVTAMPIFVGYG